MKTFTQLSVKQQAKLRARGFSDAIDRLYDGSLVILDANQLPTPFQAKVNTARDASYGFKNVFVRELMLLGIGNTIATRVDADLATKQFLAPTDTTPEPEPSDE